MLAIASFIIGCVILLKLSVQDIYPYKRLLGEGGILEYSQALILFTSAWIGWLISKDFRQRLSMRLHSVVYAIIAFVMLLVGLEEIAWGQILFGWKTPENIAAVNAQNQTTLHNLEFFQNYLDLFQLMERFISPPDLMIYLRASVPKLVENIQKRGRDYEEAIRLDYLNRLNERYEAWISTYSAGKLLVIDVDNNRFHENKEDLGVVIEGVDAELHGLFV